MIVETLLRRAFYRRLVATAAGRAHLLALMVSAEEGDEAGVFDQLQRVVDDPSLQKTIARHQADEREHAALYRARLELTGVAAQPIPDELMIIRRVGRIAGGAFAIGVDSRSAAAIATREDVMNTYALLLAIEERGVEQFPIIGQEFRRIGDHETAETFDRVAGDELRHTKYCHAIGRRYAPDDRAWDAAVRRYRAIEQVAFRQVGLSGVAYALEHGLIGGGFAARALGARLRQADPPRGTVGTRSGA